MISVETLQLNSFFSNCYIVHNDCKNALIVIDPYYDEKLFERIASYNSGNIIIMLTHEHYDHTTGVNEIKKRFAAKLICNNFCAERIANMRNNRPLSILGINFDGNTCKIPLYVCIADKCLSGNCCFDWNGVNVKVFYTPGHSIGSVCIAIEDYVFVGDVAILDTPTITRFPTGNSEQYNTVTIPYLLGLRQTDIIMPGHGESYKISDVVWKDGRFIRKHKQK